MVQEITLPHPFAAIIQVRQSELTEHVYFVSGPGSLPPGLMTKRRIFDDGSSDISSTPSSMMEYTG
jgi:hypothetical protein